MTLQERMRAKLAETGLPHKAIECYGRQIVVTAWSRDAADKWASLIRRFARVRGVYQGIDYNQDQSKASSCLLPDVHKVWRVAAVIE